MNYFSKLILCLVVVVLSFVATTALAENCSKESWNVSSFEPDTTINWKVKKGEVCASLNRKGYVYNFSVLIRAQHGLSAVTNGMADRGFAYRASSNYIGADQFQVGCNLHPSYQTDVVKCTITVKVTVVDDL